MNKGPTYDAQWTYDTPVHSDVEAKLRKLLIDMGKDSKILGVQVCAYKDGEVIIDTAAGVLGEDDPRPVQPDSLFNVFSTTKGITAGILHWLVDNGKLKLDENVANIWPEFGTNGKDTIKVHHVLNHTDGLHNAVASNIQENPQIMADYDECLRCVAMSIPETEPGRVQLYHYLSFGWLCAGIIERASGRKFQELLEEVFVRPLNVQGELYIGIPTGVESRLAELTVDEDELKKLEEISKQIPNMPSTFDAVYFMTTLAPLYNRLDFRRSVIPAANAHCSARALARYYAALVDGGLVPPSHSSSSRPPLGSHPHIPNGSTGSIGSDQNQSFCKIFSNPRIHDQFLGLGEYENLVLQNLEFGLGFKKMLSEDDNVVGFGHAGMGGFVAYSDIKNRFAIAVTINKLGLSTVTAKIVEYVCLELDIPVPKQYVSREQGPDMQLKIEKPVIN